jgi:transcriptional regulator with XRE-family HTH domain
MPEWLPNLRARRISAGLTQDQLARRANVSLMRVQRLELDGPRPGGPAQAAPTEETQLAAALSTTVADLRGL